MNKFYEVTVAIVVATLKNGKDKVIKELYLVNAMSVTEAEARLIKYFEKLGTTVDYTVKSAKESRVIQVVE